MINLMSYDDKKQTRAARMNVELFKYIIILGFSVAFLALACITTYFFLYNNKVVPTNNTSSSLLQKQADTINTDLATAKNILDRQVVYSDVITGIATALPSGTILDSLTLNDNSFGSTTNLKVLARSADSESKLKENFSNSSLFSNYKLQSTTTGQSSSSEYPTIINVSITINKVIAQ